MRMKKWSIGMIFAVLAFGILCSVPVGVHAAGRKMSIRWQGKKRSVAVGKKLSLKVKIRHKKRGTKLLWKSSSKKIATVSKRGVVSGKKAGKVKVTVRIKGTGIKKSCTVRVKKSVVSVTSAPNRTAPPGLKPTQKPKAHVIPAMKPTTEPAVPGGNPGETTHNPAKPTMGPMNPTNSPGMPTAEPVAPTDSPSMPTAAPGYTASPSPSSVPEQDKLVPYTAVTEIQGETMTVYLIQKNYEGQIHVRINDKEFTAAGKAKDALLLLAYGGTTRTDSTGRIRLSRALDAQGALEPYWTVEDLVQGQSYQMRAETRNTVYPDYENCGAIYFRGDVTSVIEVY